MARPPPALPRYLLPGHAPVYPVGQAEFIACEQRSAEWLEARKRFKLTASVVPDLLGVGYKTRMARIAILRGHKEDTFTAYSRAVMQQGTDREPEALELLTELAGPTPRVKLGNGIFWNRVWPWMGATPDGTYNHRGYGTTLCPIETKAPENTEEFKPIKLVQYRIQLEVQMRCMAAPEGWLFIYHPTQQCHWFVCTPNDWLWREIQVASEYALQMLDRPDLAVDRMADQKPFWADWAVNRSEFGPCLRAAQRWEAQHAHFFACPPDSNGRDYAE